MRLVDAPRLSRSLGTYTEGTLTYSSRDGHTGLVAGYALADGWARRPIVALMHGFSEDADAIATATRRRWADRGFAAIALGMRGRNGATGANDADGREILDILDGVAAVRAQLGTAVSSTRAVLLGYSGGGANAYACAAKIPDYFSVYVANFGFPNLGGDPPGWYETDAAGVAVLDPILGSPGAAPTLYSARSHLEPAIRNLKLAPEHVTFDAFCDQSDPTVSHLHSTNFYRRAEEERLTGRVTLHESTSSDTDRWTHAYPELNPSQLVAEEMYWRRMFNTRPWTMPAAGETIVAGFLVTRGFEVWLSDDGEADPDTVTYCKHRAKLVWRGNDFTITPLDGTISARVRRGGQVATNTSISTTTTLDLTPA